MTGIGSKWSWVRPLGGTCVATPLPEEKEKMNQEIAASKIPSFKFWSSKAKPTAEPCALGRR